MIGAGGHARVLLDALLLEGKFEVVAVLDREPSLWGQRVLGIPIEGGDDLLESYRTQEICHCCIGIGGHSDNHPRKRAYEAAVAAGYQIIGVQHPDSTVSAFARVHESVQVLAGARICAGAELDEGTIVNTQAVIDHDCRVRSFSHIASGAILAGGVTVETGAHIGAGAVVRQGRTIGSWAIVGAGAAAVRDVSPGTIAIGVPAETLLRR